jgi:hypothetical protein
MKSAVLSENGKYRYRLDRKWGKQAPIVWVMLNPSTADARKDDATIRRCCGFAKQWNAGGIVVYNLFAYRATNPQELGGVPDPVGPKNDIHLAGIDPSLVVVCAWGVNGNHFTTRIRIVKRILGNRDLWCLGLASGQPRHPGRIPYSTRLVRFKP